jgi:hypothetical protein
VVSGSGRCQFGGQALPGSCCIASPARGRRRGRRQGGVRRRAGSATNRTGSKAGSGCDGAREVRANDSSRGARAGAVGGDPSRPAAGNFVTALHARRCYGRVWAGTAVYPSSSSLPALPGGRALSVGRAGSGSRSPPGGLWANSERAAVARSTGSRPAPRLLREIRE